MPAIPTSARRVVYLTCNGLMEPLGQSQIWPYLRGLSDEFAFTLISFEKPVDRSNAYIVQSMKSQCYTKGVKWIALCFFANPRPWAPLLGSFSFCMSPFGNASYSQNHI